MAETKYGDGGDYFEDDDDPWAVLTPTDQAAAEFLQVLNEVRPDALDQLKQEVLPSLPVEFSSFAGDRGFAARLAHDLKERADPGEKLPASVAERLRQFGIHDDQLVLDDRELEMQYERLKAQLSEPIDAVFTWISSLGIPSEPVIQLVIETLADWKDYERRGIVSRAEGWGTRVDYFADPDRDQKEWDLDIRIAGVEASLGTLPDFELLIRRACDPLQETWSQAKARIREAFEAKLVDFRREVEAMAESLGAKVPLKRSSRDHFRWLVSYQIDGLSYKKIATKDGKDRKTVSEGIESAAELIELRLRARNKPGRPVGVREPRPRNRLG